MNISKEKQVQEFHHQIVELVKKYQFRDRNQLTCCGLSVSQCYVLETLNFHDNLTMNQLADKMHLKISTITRVIDQLVKKKFVVRVEHQDDRRFRSIRVTEAGEAAFRQSWDKVFESETMILEQFPEKHRILLIDFLKKLNQAVTHWQSCCSDTK